MEKLLPHATVGELSQDSTNIEQIVAEEYRRLSQKVSLQYPGQDLKDAGVSVKVKAYCNTDQPADQDESICSNVQQSTPENPSKIEFEVTLTWDGDKEKCPEDQTSLFSIFGMDASASVDLSFICDCQCEKTLSLPDFIIEAEDKTSQKFTCNEGNYTTCGLCECPPNKTGNMCECDAKTDGDKDFYVNCINPDEPEENRKICSNWGTCSCGKCQCMKFGSSRTISGEYCQCDTDTCPKGDNGLPCGGPEHGIPQCDGTCECKPGWKMDSTGACDCSSDESTCYAPDQLGTVRIQVFLILILVGTFFRTKTKKMVKSFLVKASNPALDMVAAYVVNASAMSTAITMGSIQATTAKNLTPNATIKKTARSVFMRRLQIPRITTF